MDTHTERDLWLVGLIVALCLITLLAAFRPAHGQARHAVYLPIVASPVCPSFAPVQLPGDGEHFSCVWRD